MCTASFVPTRNGFIFTSNRDEHVSRSAEKIIIKETLVYPQDAHASGTWLLVGRNRYIRCLLNGAKQPHQRRNNYRLSRGIMLLESDKFDSIDQFINDYDFNNIEPFTIVNIDMDSWGIQVIYWNEKKIEIEHKAFDQAHIWTSSPLYPKELYEKRLKILHDFLENNSPNPDDLRKLHNSKELHPNFLLTTPFGVETLSTTQVFLPDNSFVHENLVKGTKENFLL